MVRVNIYAWWINVSIGSPILLVTNFEAVCHILIGHNWMLELGDMKTQSFGLLPPFTHVFQFVNVTKIKLSLFIIFYSFIYILKLHSILRC